MNDKDYENDERSVQDEKQEKAARTIYVILAVLITATMVISVITAINRRRSKLPEPVPGTTGTESAVIPDKPKDNNGKGHGYIDLIPDTQATKPPQKTEPAAEPKEKDTEPAPKTEPVTEPEEPASVDRIYVVPAAGHVIKDYTMDLPVYSLTMNDYRVHNGIDITSTVGSPVYAFSDGVVKKIHYDPMMGQTVIIDHGDGLESKYQNLQITLPDGIEEGSTVSAGEIIGAVGETALIECAEVPHLHFTVLLNGNYVPPSDYIGSIDPVYEE
ncbi:MAG: peptidoglycan DD-metalloendopeptidase family protein [Clostridia bacterium]|nr:peptidoglycan DD-metalloendopeptidase family protein [Clostridia bacterium]